MKIEDEDKWLARVAQHLDQAQNELDDATRARLRQSRERALKRLDSRGYRPPTLWAGAALAGLCCVAIYLGVAASGGDQIKLLTDSELILDQESLEFYDQLDFYLWLDGQLDLADEA